jgi:hypothetical protein
MQVKILSGASQEIESIGAIGGAGENVRLALHHLVGIGRGRIGLSENSGKAAERNNKESKEARRCSHEGPLKSKCQPRSPTILREKCGQGNRFAGLFLFCCRGMRRLSPQPY